VSTFHLEVESPNAIRPTVEMRIGIEYLPGIECEESNKRNPAERIAKLGIVRHFVRGLNFLSFKRNHAKLAPKMNS
jgi:hypothetical protein